MPTLRTVALFAFVGLLACGRTTPYEVLREVQSGTGGGGGAGLDAGVDGGEGEEHEVAPGCDANEVRYTGRGPTPPPAGIPRIQILLGFGTGLTGSTPWFDWSTGLITGTASRSGEATFSFESVVVRVRIDAGDSANTVAARLVRCARVPGYRFETSAPNAFVAVRRSDSQMFAHIFVDNSRMQPRFVFEDVEGIPYWLSIMQTPQSAPFLLTARGKPICGGGPQANEPTERRVAHKQGVLFSWDGTYFTDGGACLQRQMFDGGTVYLTVCGRLASAPLADPFTRPDSGNVDCISQEAVLGPFAPGTADAIVFNW